MPRPHTRQVLPIAALAACAAAALLSAVSPHAIAQSATSGSASSTSPAPLTAASAATPTGAPCVLIFGQGRNFDPEQPAANRRWDEINGAFNLAVREPLVAAGLPVVNVVLPVSATDLPRNLQGLLAEVQRRGCSRVLETAVFADTTQGLLIARLRVYPVLGLLGPQMTGNQPRIGAIAYTQQKEFALDARVMDRVNPSRLGRGMAEEALPGLVPPSIKP